MILSNTCERLESMQKRHFDVFICAAGYEKRSSALLCSGVVDADRIYALRFPGRLALSGGVNVQMMASAGAEMIDNIQDFCRVSLGQDLMSARSCASSGLKVGVDFSSMNRTMIASVLCALYSFPSYIAEVELFYLPAEFVGPRYEFSVDQIGPVIPEFSGFDSDPSLPFGLVLGIGYEFGFALGMINQIEPKWTLCFRAQSVDKRYDVAVREANLGYDFGAQNVDVVGYPVIRPMEIFQYLENVVFGMLSNYRVVIAPLGPKVFAVVSLLIALKNFGQVAVWRVASHLEPEEAVADGSVVSFRIDIRAPLLGEGQLSLKQLFIDRKYSFPN